MTGKATKNFDIWEAHRYTTGAAKLHKHLLCKVKVSPTRRMLDRSAKKIMQHGGDPVDIEYLEAEALGGATSEELDHEGGAPHFGPKASAKPRRGSTVQL